MAMITRLQEIPVQEFLKSVFVLIPYGNVFFAENYSAAVDCVNLLKIHDKGAMNSHESAGRQPGFQVFQRGK